jgi:hypothetical protein
MPKRPWAKYLTDQERKAIKLLDARIAKGSEQVSILRMRRRQIQNRATARASHAKA